MHPQRLLTPALSASTPQPPPCARRLNPHQDEIFLTVRGGTTVDDLRRLVEARTSVGVERQRLVCNGLMLSNGAHDLRSLAIGKTSTLHLFPRPAVDGGDSGSDGSGSGGGSGSGDGSGSGGGGSGTGGASLLAQTRAAAAAATTEAPQGAQNQGQPAATSHGAAVAVAQAGSAAGGGVGSLGQAGDPSAEAAEAAKK